MFTATSFMRDKLNRVNASHFMTSWLVSVSFIDQYKHSTELLPVLRVHSHLERSYHSWIRSGVHIETFPTYKVGLKQQQCKHPTKIPGLTQRD